MKFTKHAHKRMGQRGITRAMVDLVREYGALDQDRAILDRRGTERLIGELEQKVRIAKRIRDKGGLVVVEAGAAVVTAYNVHSSN